MSTTVTPSTAAPTTATEAEVAWLGALAADTQDGMRRLLHPDCVVVHGPVGHIHDGEEFLRYAAGVGRIREVRVHDVVTQHLGGPAVVSCLQESRIAFVPDLTPFVIQAAVTRVWVPGAGGWLLAHMQMARRQMPG